MSRLEELIQELCPNGVEYKQLGDVGKICMCKRILKSETSEQGDVPFFKIGTFGNKPNAYISQAIFEKYKSNYPYPKKGDILISAAGTIGKIVIFDGKPAYFQDSNIVWIDNDESMILNQFLYHYYQLQPWTVSKGGTIARIYNDNIKKAKIPVPPIEVQSEIVRILDKFVELIDNLNTELVARKKQYEYYRDNLLTFDNTVPKVKLKEVAITIFRGSGITRNQITEEGIPCVRYGEIYTKYNIYFDKCISHTNLAYVKCPKYFEYGDILFAITGESVKDIAKSIAYVGHERCLAGGDTVVLKHKQNPKYLSYALSTYDAQQQKSKGKTKNKVVHSNVPSIKNIDVPLPSLEEQNRIVSILDKFDTLCNEIQKEIALRQKQYDYYRDQLLTFKELER